MKRTTIFTTIGAVTGAAASAYAAGGAGENGGDLVIWGFICFCALILIGQLIPALVAFLSAKKVLERQVKEELVDKSSLEKVHAVFDRK